MTPFLAIYLTLLAFFFGACVGSFLNVCIYRIPRDESVVAPRSHCPNCGRMIAWYDNIPLVSYIALHAKCRTCGIHITARYFLVELLTAVLFLAVWNKYGLSAKEPHYELIPIYWLVISGLILGTFVDFEHMILPDRVTIGGMIAGLLLSLAAPSMHAQTSVWLGLKASLIGLAVGFGALFGVTELGKLAFGRKRVTPDQPIELAFSGDAAGPVMQLGDESIPWDELFGRTSDKWILECESATLGDRDLGAATLCVKWKGWELSGGEPHELAELAGLKARVKSYVYPREAMGFGDVKLMGAIGAFFGWSSIVFTVLVSSVIGSLVGIYLIVARKYEWQSRIPYGPYIALACLIWMLGGREWWLNYWGWLTGMR